jgi:predicted DNA-binding transcriptional regulator AlpA
MKNSEHTPRLGDARAVCAILGCGPTHVWELGQAGKITPIRLGRRMTRYDLAEVHALADELIAAAKQKAAARRAEPARLAA